MTQRETDMPSPEEIRAVMERYAELMCASDIDGALLLLKRGWPQRIERRDRLFGLQVR